MSLSSSKFFSFFLYLFLLLLPLIYIPGIFNPYEYPKFIFFVGFSFIFGLIFVFSAVFYKASPCRARRGLDKITVLVLIYLLIMFLADIFGLDPKISFLGSLYRYQGFITLLSGVLLFLVLRNPRINHSTSEESWLRKLSLPPSEVISAILISAFAIYQWVSVYIFHEYSIPTYQGRIVGTMGNPNSLGGYLVMLLPFVLFPVFQPPPRSPAVHLGGENEKSAVKVFCRRRLLREGVSFLIFLLIIFAIYSTGSRSAMLAGAFVIFIFLIKSFSELKKIIFSFSLLIAGLFLIFFLRQELDKSCKTSFDLEFASKITTQILPDYNCLGFFRTSMWDNQLIIWQGGIDAFFKRPILGYGQENFELAFTKVKFIKVDNAHNIFLEVLISSGVLGLFTFLLIIYFALKKSKFLVKISLLAFLIVGQFNPLSIAQIAFFWFLLAL